jgi:His/Glu/Gln/Arg/opine family amino acid ABC transporter permease subunit
MTADGTYQFNWSVVFQHWHPLLIGALVDLRVASIGFGIGCLLGLVLALLRLSRIRPFKVLSSGYITVLSGCPAYVLLLWIYFGLADALSVGLSPLQAITVSMSLIGGAYTAEVFRAAVLTIDRGQTDASRSLGLGVVKTYWFVMLPQAIRVAVAPLGNVYIMLMKGATIMSVISAPDMIQVASNLNSQYFTPFETYAAVGALLVAFVLILSALLKLVERVLEVP